MTKFLQTVLDGREPLFSLALRQLEKMTGSKSLDIAYTEDILGRARDAMQQLGLDARDTTAAELCGALDARAADEEFFGWLKDVAVVIDDEVISFNLEDIKSRQDSGASPIDAVGRNVCDGLVSRYSDGKNESEVRGILRGAGVSCASGSESLAEVSRPESNQNPDAPLVLCVGDIISDAFIKLSESHAEAYTDDKGYKKIGLELGSKLPYDDVEIVQAVECSPNAAVSLTRLGLRTSLMSWIGDDTTGEEMVEYLKGQGVSTGDMVVEKGIRSNYHYVLRYGADRIKLQRFENYSYRWHDPAEKPDWLYLGVLGEKTWPLHEAMLDYMKRNPEIKLVFQPGMYHLMWGAEKLADFYRRAEIVIMNREEAAQVTGLDRGDIEALVEGLHDLGVTVAVVTDGPEGAYASRTGEAVLFMENYPDPQPPFDRTGAGDAFASTIAGALALGEKLETALEWAPINSMSVVQKMGAQAGLLRLPELKEYFANAPEGYRPKELN